MNRLLGWWFEWSDYQYMRHTGTVWWRFWFEVTGQGHSARKYNREQKKAFEEFKKWLRANPDALAKQHRPTLADRPSEGAAKSAESPRLENMPPGQRGKDAVEELLRRAK